MNDRSDRILKRIKTGRYVGHIPFGYNIDGSINEHHANIIKDIFTLCISISMREIRKKIYGTHNKIFSHASYERILKNKFYIGIITYKDVEYPHIYETFISKKLFDEVQDAKKSRIPILKHKKVKKVIQNDQIRIDQGRWPGQNIFGYKKNGLDFEINEHEAIGLKKAFELYATGDYSFEHISIILQEKYGLEIHPTTVQNATKNKFYIGIMRWNKKEFPHIHTLFINENLFEQCQQVRIKRQQNKLSRGDIRKNQMDSINKGIWICSPPFGYKRENGTIKSSNPESDIVKDIFDTYISQKGKVQNTLNILNEKYGITLSRSKIDDVIRNRFYVGIMIIKSLPHPHYYDTFISKDTFNAANEIMLKNKNKFHDKKGTLRRNLETTHSEKFKMEKGLYTHNLPPFGYKKSENGIIINSDQAIIIKDCFETYAQGNHTLLSLGSYIKDKYGLIKNEGNIRYILRYKFYKGIAECKGVNYRHIHGNIITEELFDKVQAMLMDKYVNKKLKVNRVIQNVHYIYPEDLINNEILNICETARSLDEIIDLCQLSFEEVQSMLFDLELEGKIKEVGPNIWITTPKNLTGNK